jgi:xanthine dehydrogenase accessory factor
MSDRLRQTAAHWHRQQRAAVVVEVAQVRGSAPREAGARMLVSADEVEGTIGGGHLELDAVRVARETLAGRAAAAQELRYALGPSLGQCCGGTVVLRLQPLTEAAIAEWPLPEPRFTLQLYGAGHVGRAIVHLLEGIACRVQWIDEREAEFPAEPSAAHIERVCVDAVEAEIDRAPAGACVLILTHSHDLDLRIVERALRRDDLAFVGLIGSATKRARFEHRLLERGIAPARVAAMACPIGLPGIGGKEPEVIAVSVVADLLQRASSSPATSAPRARGTSASAARALPR